MRSVFLFLLMSISLLSCYETVEYESSDIILNEPPHRSFVIVNLKLIDSTGNWSKTVNFNKLELQFTDKNWEKISNNYDEPLLKKIKDINSSTVESLQVNLKSRGNGYNFFKLIRNENIEDKIIAFYEDMSKECSCVGERLIKILYNGKEYPVESKHIIHEVENPETGVTPIDVIIDNP